MPEVQMPKLSDTMTEGTLVSWKKKKGDKVSAGEVIAEIETDKATMEWESPEDGTLTEIYVEEGGKVNVGDKIAFIGEEGEEAPKEEKRKAEPTEEKKAEAEKPAPAKEEEDETAPPQEKEKAAKRAEPKKAPEKPKASTKRSTSTEEARVKASPVARRVAAELGVDLANVNGTGPEGRVTETDVRAAAKSISAPATAPRPTSAAPKPGQGTRINLSGMRKVIAQRLVESKAPVPHFYLNIDIDAGPLMAARAELKSAGGGGGGVQI